MSNREIDTISPYIVAPNIADAIEYYKTLFGARELYRLENDGIIYHSELLINQSLIMLSDALVSENDNHQSCSQLTLGIYVDDVDETVKKAIRLKSLVVTYPQNQFWGDRMATIVDPFGIKWGIATRVADISRDEIKRRFNKIIASTKKQNDEIKCSAYRIRKDALPL